MKLKYFVLILPLIYECYAQSENIQSKQSELNTLKSEIENLENELASKSAAEKKSFETYENLNRQSFLMNKVVSGFRTEIKNKDKEISATEKRIELTEKEIKKLKDNYAKYIKIIYKKGKYNELESLFNSSSLQQALVRNYYLKVFSENRKKDLGKLEDKKAELAENKILLEKERKEKSLLAASKDKERKALNKKLNEKKVVLNSIKQKKNELKKVITAKKESQKKIEQLIAKLIEEETVNKEQIASSNKTFKEKSKINEESTGYEYDLNTSSFASFSALKGKMNWPLHKGKVIRKFGEDKNTKLNTVTLNYGIDIKADKDKNVRSVAEGVVAAIDWLPGYGNVVIISHKDEYRTVYSHLAEIFVNEGDKIKSGLVLALVDEGLDGYVLHFEIWKGRDKQNPENWLGKR